MNCKATGLLQHHFWGSYCASIALGFETPDQARAALESGLLGPGWKPGRREQALVWHGSQAELDQIKALLGGLGADTAKIDSLRYSVDYGEDFDLNFEVEVKDSRQLELGVVQC